MSNPTLNDLNQIMTFPQKQFILAYESLPSLFDIFVDGPCTPIAVTNFDYSIDNSVNWIKWSKSITSSTQIISIVKQNISFGSNLKVEFSANFSNSPYTSVLYRPFSILVYTCNYCQHCD